MSEPTDIMRRIPPDPIAETLTHADEMRLADWIRDRARIEDLLRCLESKSWSAWRTGLGGFDLRSVRLRPEILAAIRRHAAERILTDHGGRYEDGRTVVRSDGTRIWTELA